MLSLSFFSMHRRSPSPTNNESPPHSPGSSPSAPNPHAWLETLPHAQLVDLVATMISKPPAAARSRSPPPAEQEVRCLEHSWPIKAPLTVSKVLLDHSDIDLTAWLDNLS
jgi:hypothetical protein